MTDNASKVPNAPGWWLRWYDVGKSYEHQRVETVHLDKDGLHFHAGWGRRVAVLDDGQWNGRLIHEAEHTEAVRLADERHPCGECLDASGSCYCSKALCAEHASALRRESAALRAELEAERHNRDLAQDGWARCQAALEAAKAEMKTTADFVRSCAEDTWCSRDESASIIECADAVRHACRSYGHEPEEREAFLRSDLAAARARIAELEAHADRLTTIVDEAVGLQPVQSAEDTLTLLERHLYERRTAIARMKAERDEAGRARHKAECERDMSLKLANSARCRHVETLHMHQVGSLREYAVEHYGQPWADEHFPEGT